jgi:hypothetical protein
MARIEMTAAVYRRISKREIVLAADDRDVDLWHAIHALQTRYRKNW